MNRIFPRTPAAPKATTQKALRRLQPARRLHTEAELMLRDIAYVLQLTQRVKASILEKCEETATAAV
jgi:hypothetical protein